MISTDELIKMEKDELDRIGETASGSELALFVAKRTRKYVVQEVGKYLRDRKHLRLMELDGLADDVETFFKD